MTTSSFRSSRFRCLAILVLAVASGCSSAPPPETAPEVPPIKPRLVCVRGMKEGTEYPLREGHNLIGRGDKMNVVEVNLTDQEAPGQKRIAVEHARLIIENGKFHLDDLHSNKGTFLNGKRVSAGKQEPLKPGDTIQLGGIQLKFLTEPESKAEKLVPLSPLRLVCVRGQKRNAAYPLFEGENVVGLGGEQPVEIDLDDQEETDRVYVAPRHARITASGGSLTIEDLQTERGTYVNRKRLAPGAKEPLKPQDTVQVGGVWLQVVPADRVASFRSPAPLKTQVQVARGANPKLEYPLYEGKNIIGRPGELAVDIDLSEQESGDKGRSAPQHAVITCADGKLTIEDLKTKEGIFVNRTKIKPGTKVEVKSNDTIQIGAVQLRIVD